jgi:hypothetical protein
VTVLSCDFKGPLPDESDAIDDHSGMICQLHSATTTVIHGSHVDRMEVLTEKRSGASIDLQVTETYYSGWDVPSRRIRVR